MKRLLASYVIVMTVLLSNVGVFGMPRRAAAQLMVTDPITGTQTTIKNVWDYLLRILGGGAVVAVMNAAGYFAQKVAYDTAVYVASGGKGQGALFEARGAGDYLRDTALSAAGEGIGTLNELGFAGFNLCDPTGFGAPQFKIRVLLGLGAQFASPNGPRPKCEWNNISANWEQFSRTVSSGEVLRRASIAFEPGESQLGVAAQSTFKLGELAAQKANEALEDLKIGQGFKALTHPISGQIKTPSDVVREEAAQIPGNARRAQQGQMQVVGPALAQGALSILPAALGTFVNTLSSKLLQQLFKKGLFDAGSLACKAGANLAICRGALQNPEFAGRGGEAAARAAFADFITPAIQSQQSYDALTEFSVCPDQFRSPSNCVMDERFAAVVRQARVDRAVTVRDAIAQGYLHGDWPLVAATGADQGKNQDPYCFASGYCFGNLQKLRKARIIPIGWELAAAKAQNGRPTLREVMNGFNDCPTPESPNPADHPHCRLIDPDWVLLYPASQCRARVYGPTLISGESDLRAQTCVDAPGCIAEDEKGNCIADYGYCTREKTVWQLGGDSCPAQYATCTSYQARTGGNISVLTNTVDYGVCSSENVGCRGFSRSQDPGDGAGDWTLSDRVFLSAQAARCEARDAGCSEVLLMPDGRTTSTTASFLKLPPAYLGCTGEASDPPECAAYAHICRPSERGCELYTPTDGTPPVPGTVAESNRCPAACIGYTTYRQEESAFDFAAYPLHFIASSARQCTARAAGCTEFTNLDTLAGGGEAREYYSELRACKKSDDAAARIFYTWEGSEAAGFQLKEWRLIADADAGPALMAGADPAACTRDIFRLPAASPRANPDCREFYNTDGAVFYRLYSKTIVATDDCHPYRMTSLPADPGGRAPADACAAKGGEWRAAGSECVFLGYPAESRSCAAAENGCRLYVGNAGRNVRDIFFDDFEGGDRSGWGLEGDTAVSTESVFQGQHSLRISRGAARAGKTVLPREGGTYFLNFWAKGRGTATVRFAGAPSPDRYFADRTVTLRENWNLYTFGPVTVDWPSGEEDLEFVSGDGRGFADIIYIDKIQLRQVTGTTALIKDSWRTPAICDQTAEGAIVPQAQLNCRAYRDRAGRTLSVTGFDSICRAEAVGCTALTETQESASSAAETWNALCVGTPGPCSIDRVERCTIPSGRLSCRYRVEGTSPGIACGPPVDGIPLTRRADGTCAASDEVVVPADRVTFAVNDQRMSCTPDKAGCEAVGLPRSGVCRLDGRADRPTPCPAAPGSPTLCMVQTGEQSCRYPLPAREPYPPGTALEFETAVVKNDPRTYNRSLCTIDAVGCESWQASAGGAVAYFKQPDDRLCEYREQVPSPGGSRSGWFKKGTDEACDPSFVIGGNFNGIRRNGDPEYAGFVGQCPAQHNSCTEFVDPTDRVADLYPNGRPYFYLKNEKLDTASCAGQVSPKAGCVLFTDASNPARSWNAGASNLASRKENDALVAAVSCPAGQTCQKKCYYKDWSDTLCVTAADCPLEGVVLPQCLSAAEADALGFVALEGTPPPLATNNTNAIIKVKQSRQCGEWLACQSSTSVWDARENRFKEICDQVGLCNQYSATEPGRCQNWVTGRTPSILTEEAYRGRDTSLAGMEYSGYSIPGNFPTELLSQVTVGGELRLARVLGSCPAIALDGDACTVNGERGSCYNHQCAQAVRANTRTGLPEPLTVLNALPASCRAYPEQNSPFPAEVVTFKLVEADNPWPRPDASRTGFQNAKTCEKDQICDCSYRKVSYGGGSSARYFNSDLNLGGDGGIPRGVCQGGIHDAKPCNPESRGIRSRDNLSCKSADEAQSGTCQAVNRNDKVIGLESYCLEKDSSVSLNGNPVTLACLTWYPSDRLSGSVDIYNQYASAGFLPGDAYFCAVPEMYKQDVGIFGIHSQMSRSLLVAGESHNISLGCAEYSSSECTFDDKVTDGCLEDNLGNLGLGKGIPQSDCPADVGFLVIANTEENGDQCGSGDDDFEFFCVPWGSRRSDGSQCTFQDLAGQLEDRFVYPDGGCQSSRNGAHGRIQDEELCELSRERQTKILLVPARHLTSNQGYTRQNGRVSPAEESEAPGSALDVYGDCVSSDRKIFSWDTVPASPYLGCSVAVKVSDNENSKAYTNRVAWRETPPAASVFTIEAASAPPEIRYQWISEPTPFGESATAGISDEPNPLAIPMCSREGQVTLRNPTDNNCPAPGTPIDGANRNRPYLAVVSGGIGSRCTLGPSGDLSCSGSPSCDLGNPVADCYLPCDSTPIDPDGTCPERGLGSCVRQVGGTDVSSPPHPLGGFHGVCSTAGSQDQAACRGVGGIWIGQCRGGNDQKCVDADGRRALDCISKRCVASGVARGGEAVGVCDTTGVLSANAVCDAYGNCRSYGVDAQPGRAAPEPARAITRLQQLFTKIFDVVEWNPVYDKARGEGIDGVDASATGGKYVSRDSLGIQGDYKDIAGDFGRPPTVRAIGDECRDNGRCTEGQEDAITVNNQSLGTIVGGSGAKLVTAKFFGYANDDQMPLKHVIVDWGDGGEMTGPFPGSYKNHRGWKFTADGAATSECDGTTFGRSAGACDDASPFIYNHSYSCPRGASAASMPEGACDGPTESNCWNREANACQFVPRVQLKDNWGFCNGRCEGAPGREFCYDDLPNGGRNECDVSGADLRVRNLDHWTTFAGQVLVSPP